MSRKFSGSSTRELAMPEGFKGKAGPNSLFALQKIRISDGWHSTYLLRGADNRLLSPQRPRGRREEHFLLSGERPESKKSFFHLPAPHGQMKISISAFSATRTNHVSGVTSGR